jgi:DNA-binding beta-propeller fold protein YncE
MSRFRRLPLVVLAVVFAACPASAATLAEALDQPSWTFTTGDDLPWTGQAATTWDGVDAAQAGWSELDPGVSWMETTRVFDTDGVISFRWKVVYAELAFLVDGVEAARSFWQTDWELRSLAIPAGTHTLRWEVRPDPWAEAVDGWVDEVAFEPVAGGATLADALDQPAWSFSVGGDALWAGETARTHDGADAAQSGPMRKPFGEAWFETTRTLASGSTIDFWWKVSGARPLLFFVDGFPAAEIQGIVDWEPRSWAVAAGTHTLRWQYGAASMDGWANADAGWVDQVSVTPSGTTFRTLSVLAPDGSPEWSPRVYATPADVNAREGGATPLSLLYEDGTQVELEADDWFRTGFGGWLGCDSVEGRVCRVALTADRSVSVWYQPEPTLLWYDTVDGSSSRDDGAGGVALAPDGGVWATGTVDSGGPQVWLGRYDAWGAPLGQATFAGRGADVAVAPDGSVYVTGTAAGRLFVRKLSAGGATLWTRTRAGTGNGIAVSPDGASVYVTGSASGNVLLQKYSADGVPAWAKTVNGSANRADAGRRVAVAPGGDVFVVGFVSRTGRGKSAWVRKYSPAGAILWTATADSFGKADDWGSGLTLFEGRVFVTGSAGVPGLDAGARGVWSAAFTESGSLLWSNVWTWYSEARLEGVGLAVSPTRTVDVIVNERYADYLPTNCIVRFNQDGTETDGGESYGFGEISQGAAAGIVSAPDGCFIAGEVLLWRSGAYDYDIFVAKYGRDPSPGLLGARAGSPGRRSLAPLSRLAPVESRVVHAR